LTTPADAGAEASASDEPFGSITVIVLLALVFAIAAFGTDMYLPAFPAIRRAFDTSPQTVQLSLSIFLYGNAAGHLFFGPLSDRFGRRPVLLLGLAAFAVASFGCALAGEMSEFLTYRLAQGAAAASGPVLVRALINDRLERERAAQTLALLTGLMALAAMLTPAAGGWLVQHATWEWIFYSIGTIAVLLLVGATAGTEETLPRERRLARLAPVDVVRGYFAVTRNLRFWCYVLPPSLMFAGVFAFAVVNSFLLIDELGMAEQFHGITYSIAALAYVAGSFTSNRLVGIVGIDRGIVFGLTLGVSSALAAVVASASLSLSIPLVVIPGLLIFYSTASMQPIAFSMAVSLFPTRRGSASAVVGFVQLSFAGASSSFAAYLYDSTTLPLHIFTLGCSAAAAFVWVAGHSLRRAPIRMS
jgi:DHA1 family bicyclomycin/chloramphenicol resistance-like MFS transporter